MVLCESLIVRGADGGDKREVGDTMGTAGIPIGGR